MDWIRGPRSSFFQDGGRWIGMVISMYKDRMAHGQTESRIAQERGGLGLTRSGGWRYRRR